MLAQFKKVEPSEGSSINLLDENISQYDGVWHYHAELELKLVLQSSGIFAIGSEIQPFEPGTLVLIGENVPHFWQNEKTHRPSTRARSIVLKFKKNFLGDMFLKAPEFAKISALFEKSKHALHIKGETATKVGPKMDQMRRLSGFPRLMIFLEILDIIANSKDIVFILNKNFNLEINIVHNKRIETITHYVTTHLGSDIRQSEIAKLVHMSPEGFSRFFKKITDSTFNVFLNQLRINKVCSELIASDKDVTEIAYECGFQSLSNFNRQFKRFKKMSPRSFRAQFR